MSAETKILLTIYLEGGSLHRGEAETREFKLTKRDLNPSGNHYKDADKVVKRGEYTHYPLIATPATQVIKLCREAYDYMTSTEVPEWFIPYKRERIKIWRKLSTKERLNTHLQRTCEHFHGKSYTYSIVED